VDARAKSFDRLLGDMGPVWRSTRRHRAFALLVLEVGVNFVVIANLLILGRWFASRAQFSTGHRERDLVEVRVRRPSVAAEPGGDRGIPAGSSSHAAEEAALRVLAGVVAVAPVSSMQSDDDWAIPDVFWAEREGAPARREPAIDRVASPCSDVERTPEGRVLGWAVEAGAALPAIADLRFIEGRAVAPGAAGVVVSRCLAQALFGAAPAVGRVLHMPRRPAAPIAGVIEDVRMRSPLLYQTQVTALYGGDADDGRSVRYLVRTAPGAAPPVARAARSALAALVPAGGLVDARVFVPTGPRLAQDAEGTVKVFVAVGGCLGLAALFGNGTVAAFSVAARRRGLAIRRALGATRGDIFRQLWIEAMIPTVMGCALGLGLTALLLTQSRALFPGLHLELFDAAATALALWSTAVPTRIIPALRSVRLTPAEAGRTL